MGMSSSKSSSQPVDMTPEAFKALQTPFANVLMNLIQNSAGTVGGLVNGYKGPTSAGGPTSNEQGILNQLMGLTGSTGSSVGTGLPGTAMNTPNRNPTSGGFNFGDTLPWLMGDIGKEKPVTKPTPTEPTQKRVSNRHIDSGIPRRWLQRETTAGSQTPATSGNNAVPGTVMAGGGMGARAAASGGKSGGGTNLPGTVMNGPTGGQTQLPGTVMNGPTGTGGGNNLPGTVMNTPGGGAPGTVMNGPVAGSGGGLQGIMQQLMGKTALSGMDPTGFVDTLGIKNNQTMEQFLQQMGGASQTGAFGGENMNPFQQQYIDQAQRGTMQNLEETLSRSLPGRFALSGQMTQPGGSSAFDRAAAIATRGATQEMGDIATRISYQAMEEARNREAGLMTGELDRNFGRDQQYNTAVQNQLDRALQMPGLEAGIRKTDADIGQIGSNIKSQEVDNLIKNLQAQALPRLIQEMGVDRGMEAFQNQINSMLAVMGIQAGVSAPVIGNSSSSRSTGFQLK